LSNLRKVVKGRTESVWVVKTARVVSFDEMWTYVGARRGEKRKVVWIWTAVVEEEDGSRWMDYEVGGRDEDTFLRLYERLLEAEVYRSDDYNVYKGFLRTDTRWEREAR